MSERRIVGRSVPRTDAVAKVTGAAVYAVDVAMPDMLHAKVVRSDQAHARILGVDKQAALAVPGVVAVVAGSDLTGLFPRFGHIVADHAILAVDKVRYYGEPVALVIATDPMIARDAVPLVEVHYDELPALMDVAAALAPDAPPLHEDDYTDIPDVDAPPGGNMSRTPVKVTSSQKNVAHESQKSWGDVEAAFREAHRIVETTVHHPMLYAYAMEPYNAVARFVEGTLEVVSTAQHPFMVASDLARVFSLPLSHVRVTVPYVGGGYGSKSYTKVEPLTAVGAWAVGRPVKLVLDVEESIYTTRADSADIVVRSAFAADGTILARDFEIVLDTGAYADNSPLVLDKAVNRCFGPYRIPNLRVRGQAVYTSTSPASSYRGFGAFQGNLAGETNIDQAAEQLGIDPAEIRRRNLVHRGERLIPGNRAMDADLVDDLDLLVAELDASPSDERRLRGVGFGCAATDAGAVPSSTALVKLLSDGSVLVLTGSSELGQGSRTVLAQIAAEELGVDLDRVRVLQSDTATTPFERTTGASRTTTLAGLAVQRACQDVVERVCLAAREVWTDTGGPIEVRDGVVHGTDERSMTLAEAVQSWFGPGGGEILGQGVVRRTGELAELPPFWEIGMVGVSLEIDPETGVIQVDQLVTVADVGCAINPALVEGQDLGAATQGLGGTISEHLVYDGIQIVNANMVEYRVPRITDRPRRFRSLIVERADGVGPYGAKGVGEGARNPVPGAVAAAVARATGMWPDTLPLNPERVWRLLQRAEALSGAGPAAGADDHDRPTT
ncbi:xanthine dehydrogenase family protein molybdopterin-binding subunit [Modestobacter sp. VKM Ac-2979]|uniref:xanthine dehydrogenase family protein molybdopterin-binding subunit n=1 Tax=unclassified Modestobacter TaxID=2643866 RepID=UPI0022AB9C69|nr:MULTISPECIES: xanthine dehydrogenase family protein molybdopterin-binding subunit [unclassified Modestobacter]MCZ2813932.1 xanthine dehydrogenase family protein molybdopterin-binding subunit [Modestobacter sp. VKM Ac-2979]MCZ2844653.1 xanthine dehydrogenase family protein molybdopterin-binding subunit [Modestobacter sp. VKM Ac-2980]